MAKKVTISEDKIQVRNFKDGSSHWWCNFAHYYLNESNELIWCSGETDKPELREAVLSFIKRNKKVYKPREKSQIDEAILNQYSVIGFGKYSSLTTQDLIGIDKKYARWLYENCSDNKIKTELKELLKIK